LDFSETTSSEWDDRKSSLTGYDSCTCLPDEDLSDISEGRTIVELIVELGKATNEVLALLRSEMSGLLALRRELEVLE